MKSFTDRIVVLLLSLFLITYGLYQGSRYVSNPYKTETAYEYTISDSYTGKGMFIRDEMVLQADISGVPNYLFEDATRVQENMVIAEIYDDEQVAASQRRVRELEAEISALKQIEVNTSVNYTGTEAISKQITASLVNMGTNGYSQIVDNIAESRQELLGLINKKLIASNKLKDFEPRIAELESIATQLKDKNSENITQITSPLRGYFSSVVDGAETQWNTEMISNISLEEHKAFIANPPKPQLNKLGKIVEGHDWYFTMAVSSQDVAKFEKNKNLTMDFVSLDVREIPGTVVGIYEDENTGEALVAIASNYILPQLIGARVSEVNVNFRSYSGLRISSDSIRFVDNQKGVYVLQNMQVKFKAIDVVYEGNGFVLANPYSEIKNNISLFDEILVEGVDLFDGKPIKQ